MATILRHLYNAILYLYFPFILLSLYIKGKKFPEYRKRIHERFVFYKNPNIKKKTIWVHAVSLGETIAAQPLVKKLTEDYPDHTIVVTATTPTGSSKAQQAFGDTIFHRYAPYDYPLAIQRFLKYTKPELIIIMETELWPNLLHYADQQKIPVMIANARLSRHSTGGYKILFFFLNKMLKQLRLIAAQSKADSARFRFLGAKKEQLITTGNIKFDIKLPEDIETRAQTIRKNWGDKRPVWIAASTHSGEEEIILQAFAELKQNIKDALLILVPRHPERFLPVTNLCKAQGFNTISHKQQEPCTPNIDIVIGDTFGELIYLYAASDIAFVGGSLSNTGGHNLLEPVAVNKPVISGPNLANFLEISRLLKQAQALTIVKNPLELTTAVTELCTNKKLQHQQSNNGKKVINENRGALQKLLQQINELLS